MLQKISALTKSRTNRLALLAALLVILVAAAVIWRSRPASPFPVAIARQVSFVTYVPAKPWRTDVDKATYDNGVLRFTSYDGTRQILFSQQATPSVFTDVPQYLPTLVTRMHQYESFGSTVGTVYLTRPSELQGGQTALMNHNGTLLFARPSQDLTNDEWRRLCNGLQLYK